MANNNDKTDQPDVPPAVLVDQVFEVFRYAFCETFKTTYSSNYELKAAKNIWAALFESANIRKQAQVKRALNRMLAQGSGFMPTCPEFVGWCQPTPEELGIPPVRDCYQEAAKKCHNSRVKWSNPYAYNVGRLVGFHRLRNLSENESWPLFQEQYKFLVMTVINGKPLPFALPTLPERPDDTPKPDDTNETLTPAEIERKEKIKRDLVQIAKIKKNLGFW